MGKWQFAQHLKPYKVMINMNHQQLSPHPHDTVDQTVVLTHIHNPRREYKNHLSYSPSIPPLQTETPPQLQQQQHPPSTWQVSPATQNQSPRRYPQISSSPILFRSNLPGGKLGSQVVIPDLGGMSSGIGMGAGDSDNNNELPMTFHAPELPAETILDKQHNETLAKLNFVLALTDCILEVADARCAPLSALMAPEAPPIAAHPPEHCKRAERLVLLVRSLHLLRSGLLLAQEQIQLKHLKPSSTVKTGEWGRERGVEETRDDD